MAGAQRRAAGRDGAAVTEEFDPLVYLFHEREEAKALVADLLNDSIIETAVEAYANKAVNFYVWLMREKDKHDGTVVKKKRSKKRPEMTSNGMAMR